MSDFFVAPLKTQDEVNASYRLRYHVYCEERKFFAPAGYPQQLESDEFDAYSNSVGVFDEQGNLAGSARLIRPNPWGFPLFRHCPLFPDAGRRLLKIRHPVEISRMVVAPSFRRRTGVGLNRLPTSAVLVALGKAMLQEGKREGFDGALLATDPPIVRLLQRFFPLEIIGPDSDYYGVVTPCLLDSDSIFRHLAVHRPALYAYFIEGLPEELRNLGARDDYYHRLTEKNEAYLPEPIQKQVQNTRLLIAGCGRGSLVAEAAVRAGFEKLILLDGASVATDGLNRQSFHLGDVGLPRVDALSKALREINPHAEVEKVSSHPSVENAEGLVSRADVIIDTIDFIDLAGMTALHDEARRQQKPVVVGLLAGKGGGCLYFPANGKISFRRAFGLPEKGSVNEGQFLGLYKNLLARLAPHVKTETLSAVQKSLPSMEERKLSPTHQVTPGAYSLAGLIVALVLRIVQGQDVAVAPRAILFDPDPFLSNGIFDLPLDGPDN